MKCRFPIIGIAIAAMVVVGSHAQELSQEQQGELMTIGLGFAQKGAQLEGAITGKLTELAMELHLLSQLNPQAALPYETIEYMQSEIFDLPINLNLEQRKKLVSLEANLMVKEIELERDVELVLLDLEAVLLSGEARPETVDPLIMGLADLAAKEIDNRVGYFLKAKDVLTLDQKRLLVYLMGLN